MKKTEKIDTTVSLLTDDSVLSSLIQKAWIEGLVPFKDALVDTVFYNTASGDTLYSISVGLTSIKEQESLSKAIYAVIISEINKKTSTKIALEDNVVSFDRNALENLYGALSSKLKNSYSIEDNWDRKSFDSFIKSDTVGFFLYNEDTINKKVSFEKETKEKMDFVRKTIRGLLIDENIEELDILLEQMDSELVVDLVVNYSTDSKQSAIVEKIIKSDHPLSKGIEESGYAKINRTPLVTLNVLK